MIKHFLQTTNYLILNSKERVIGMQKKISLLLCFSFFYILVANTVFVQSVISQTNGWSLVSQTLTSSRLNSVWGTGSDDVFVVGEDGTILHYDGNAWVLMENETTACLNDVWGTSSDNVYAVGSSGTILHYDGTVWSMLPCSTVNDLNGIWGLSANNIYAVGSNGTLLHYNGLIWNLINSGIDIDLNGVWGTSEDGIYVVGNNGPDTWTPEDYSGSILNYNGNTCTEVSSGMASYLYDIWGNGSSDMIAVGYWTGYRPAVLQYDGDSWTRMTTNIYGDLFDVWGTSPINVYAVGGVSKNIRTGFVRHYNGSTWDNTHDIDGIFLRGIWGTSNSDILAVGDSGTILHYAGDNDPPTIISTAPADGSTGVHPSNLEIYAQFSENMDTTIAAGSLFTLTGNDGLISGSIDFSYDKITFSPSASLSPGTTYTATISNEVTDLSGNAMIEEYSWTFTTKPGAIPSSDPYLFLQAKIDTNEKGPIDAIWEKGGEDTTYRGDKVVWGYFYASQDDVNWGSRDNPDLFVKIWYDISGRVDVNYFHVSVPDIKVTTEYQLIPQEGTATMTDRYIRHYYQFNAGIIDYDMQSEDGSPAPGYSETGDPDGNTIFDDIHIGALINTVEIGPINAVWKLGGTDTTSSGDQVAWGYFYASPNDVDWGNENNPDLFVKIWLDHQGRIDVNYFHVSVPNIEVYSNHTADNQWNQTGTTIMSDRYIRHEYTTQN